MDVNYNSRSTVQNSGTLQGEGEGEEEEEEEKEEEEGEGEQEATQAREDLLVWVVNLKLVAVSVVDSVLMLFLPVLEKEEYENGGADGLLKLLLLWRKRYVTPRHRGDRLKILSRLEKEQISGILFFKENGLVQGVAT
jgi:hypothetical protein